MSQSATLILIWVVANTLALAALAYFALRHDIGVHCFAIIPAIGAVLVIAWSLL